MKREENPTKQNESVEINIASGKEDELEMKEICSFPSFFFLSENEREKMLCMQEQTENLKGICHYIISFIFLSN